MSGSGKYVAPYAVCISFSGTNLPVPGLPVYEDPQAAIAKAQALADLGVEGVVVLDSATPPNTVWRGP